MKKLSQKQILSELYSIDPSLKVHEKDVIAVIAAMKDKKPNIVIDDAFVQMLREKIVQDEVKTNVSFFDQMFMHKTPYILGAGATLALMLAIGGYQFLNVNQSPTSMVRLFNPAEMTEREENAFGNLAFGSETTPVLGTPEAVSFRAGGGVSADTSAFDSRMLIAPIQYSYRYTGEPIILEDSTLPVYRRSKANLAEDVIARQLSSAGAGLIDLGSFGSTKVRNFSLYNADYNINIDIESGQASLHKNYEQNIEQMRGPQPSDVPSEDTLIAIANTFVEKHGINIDMYSTPIVDMLWKEQQERQQQISPETYTPYTPEVISVIYPYQFDDNYATDYAGTPEGMRVHVHIVTKEVEGISNILASGFESSRYTVETDSQTLIGFAEQGGINSYGGYIQEDFERKELDLGTPQIGYIRYYLPNPGQASEVFIPALQFPVLNMPADMMYYPSYVTIPIVSDIIEQAQKEKRMPVEPPIQILQEETAIEPAELPAELPREPASPAVSELR